MPVIRLQTNAAGFAGSAAARRVAQPNSRNRLSRRDVLLSPCGRDTR
jgi:hypothetical protein